MDVVGWQVFRYITVPLMRPVILVGLVLRAMEAFKEFDKPYILTGGGPGAATEVIDMYAYRLAFVSFNFSKAAAVCIILFIFLLVCGMLYGKFLLEGKDYELWARERFKYGAIYLALTLFVLLTLTPYFG